MSAFKMKRYYWSRTTLFLEFEGAGVLDGHDRLVLRGLRRDPELDKEPREVRVPMTECHVEGDALMRARFMLGDRGNPVRAGDYQVFVQHLGDEYPVMAEEGQVEPQPAIVKRSDILLYAATSSYYEVMPLVFDGRLYCSVLTKNLPARFGYDAKRRLAETRAAYVKEVVSYSKVALFGFCKKHVPVNPKKILFTSDRRTELTGNMEPLYERIKQRGLDKELDIVFSFAPEGYGSERGRGLRGNAELSYHAATARVIFCDDFQPFLYHVRYPDKTRLVQLWHACGHFKTVGWGRIGTFDAIRPYTNDHRNYTDVIVASEADVPIYGEAFGVPEDRVKPLGIPRHDWLLDEGWQAGKRAWFDESFPAARGKRVIAFVPTFRGSGRMNAYYDFGKIDFDALARLCRRLGCFCVFKMHPFVPGELPLPADTRDVFADASGVDEVNDLLPSVDVLVTDYSSVVYEAALLNIPTLYYAYDLEEYVSSRDFYEPFEDFVSGRIVRTFDELLEAIEAGDFGEERLQGFRRKNFKHLDGGACDRIIDEIILPATRDRMAEYTEDDVRVISLSQDARDVNAQIDAAEEPFVLFVDDGATYDEGYVESLLEVMSRDEDMGSVSGLVLNHKGGTLASVVDAEPGKVIVHDALNRYTEGFILPYGVMFRTRVIQDEHLRFDEELAYCRDELFTLRYMQVSPRNARVNAVSYRAAKILDETGAKTPQSFEKRWYTDSARPLLEKLRPSDGSALTRIAQFGLLYLTIHRFKANQGSLLKMAFDSPEETEAYLAEVGEVMRNIDDEVLFCRARATSWERYKKLYLAQLRDPGTPLRFEVSKAIGNPALIKKVSISRIADAKLCLEGSGFELFRMGEQHVSVVNMRACRDDSGNFGLDIRFRMQRCFPVDSFELVVCSSVDGAVTSYRAAWETMVGGIVTFFDHYACRQDTYHVFVPLVEGSVQELRLYAQFDGYRVEKDIEFAKAHWANKLSADDGFSYWYFDGRIARSRNGAIEIRPATEGDRVDAERRYQEHLDELAEAAAAKLEAHPKSKKLQKDARTAERVALLRRKYWETLPDFEGRVIWTYNDKSYKAGDNAEYALRYAAAQDDGIEKVFFIDPKCRDAARLRDEGFTVVDPASIEGELIALHASIVHMTHVPAFLKLGLGPSRIEYFRDLLDAKVVRMYHGYPITRSASYAQMADDSAGVVVATGYERDLYTNPDNGFAPDQVVESGMPRYDDLVDDSRRQILFAPTWRPALAGKSMGGGVSAYNPDFKNSEYFRCYEAVMNDERVLDAARRNGYKIKMFLHPKMNEQTRDFSSNDVVEALNCTEDVDYVTIMRQSDLMVTDYSSVQFDFAYMRKPVVYYQDPKLPYWRLVEFDYEGMGFGEVCKDVEELAGVLVEYMDAGCSLKDEYRFRIEEFFIQSDRESGRRLYEADLELEGNGRPPVRLNPGDVSQAAGL